MPHHHERGWPGEKDLMRAVAELAGNQLEALAKMRSLVVDEIGKARIPTELPGHRIALVLILTTAISVVDAVRILLEHGYSEQALGMTRALYEAEIDTALLAAKPEWMEYYAAYEAFELSRMPGTAIRKGVFSGIEFEQAPIDKRKHDLLQILEHMGKERPEGWDDLDLYEASVSFARSVWGKKTPPNWRPQTSWEEKILPLTSPRQFEALHPEPSEDDLAEWVTERDQEHSVVYPEMSARLHGSPRVAAERWPDFQVGGFPEDVPRVVEIAATHFVRVHHVVFDELELGFDRDLWVELYNQALEPSS
jgi:hypothetical protein